MTIWIMDENGKPDVKLWEGDPVSIPNVGEEISLTEFHRTIGGTVTKRRFLYLRSGDDFDFAVQLSISDRVSLDCSRSSNE